MNLFKQNEHSALRIAAAKVRDAEKLGKNVINMRTSHAMILFRLAKFDPSPEMQASYATKTTTDLRIEVISALISRAKRFATQRHNASKGN